MRNGKIVLAEVGVGPLPLCFGATVWQKDDVIVELFEPNPLYCRELREAITGKDNVILHEVAIGDEPGEMELSDEGTSSSLIGIASPSVQHRGDQIQRKTFKVKVDRMSAFDKGDIDLLRVDTEGSEWFTIKHLISRPRQIVVEIYNDLATYINPYLWEIMEWAEKNGYRLGGVHESDFIFVMSDQPAKPTIKSCHPMELSLEHCDNTVRQMLVATFINENYGKMHPNELIGTLDRILRFKTKVINHLALYVQKEAARGHQPEQVLKWLSFYANTLKEFVSKNQNQPRRLP